MAKDLFRKVSLERLTSPDQLNQRMRVISFKTWIALATVGGILVCVILWAIFGQIPVIIQGKAVVFDPTRSILVRSDFAGVVTNIETVAGAWVNKGDLILTLRNPQVEAEIKEKELLISSLEKVETEEAKRQVLLENARLEALKRLQENEKIIAPVAGRVININLSSTEAIQAGTNLVWIETDRKEGVLQEIFAIFSFETGELIRPDMETEIAFASVDREAYGVLLGKVTKIFPYFTSFDQSPFRSLPSLEVKKYLTSGGSQSGVIIKIAPILDPKTYTGYKWSSKKGPPFAISEGTVGEVKIILEKRHPISYLINSRG